MNSNTRAKLTSVISSCLDNLGVNDASIDIPIITDGDVVVYITPPADSRDDIDYVAIYDSIAADAEFDDIDIDIEVIDNAEKSDALEGAYGTSESEDDEEEEDELTADNLQLVEDEYEGVDNDSEEDDDEFTCYDEDEVECIDEYEPSWLDLEEIMRDSDEYQ